MRESPYDSARRNYEALRKNAYPGRGIAIGMDETANLVQVYWLMGRSDDSRNRVFVEDMNGWVRTELADPAKNVDPKTGRHKDTSLTVYVAMAEHAGVYVVSNGHQTGSAMAYGMSRNLLPALNSWIYEPDSNSTPRITAACTVGDTGTGHMAILRKSQIDWKCEREVFSVAGQTTPNLGYCITTYLGDGNPLPSFRGDPYPLPFDSGGLRGIAQGLWDALNADNRVALVAKWINMNTGVSRTHIINKYERVEAVA